MVSLTPSRNYKHEDREKKLLGLRVHMFAMKDTFLPQVVQQIVPWMKMCANILV